MSRHCINFSDVEAAFERVKPLVHRTPVLTSTYFSDQSGPGREVFFKCEAYQKTGSFKFRGASNATAIIKELTPSLSDVTVVTHSSGNHAQALALAAAENGVKAHIVMPDNAPKAKLRAVEETYKAR